MMMMMTSPPESSVQPAPLRILCVDDNPPVAEALAVKLRRAAGFHWLGSLNSADELVEVALRLCPDLVLLDLDMPGRDPFDALAELSRRSPQSRVVIFSGHVQPRLVERAVELGAWGYASKNDGEDELLLALHRVAQGEFALSPEAQRAYGL